MNAVALQDDRLLGDIRTRVRQALTSSSAFNALPMAKRSEIAHDTVRAFHYILGGADGQSRPGGVELAGNSSGFAPAQGNVARFRQLTPPAPPPLGEAARRGGSAMSDLVQEIDFPSFVGGL